MDKKNNPKFPGSLPSRNIRKDSFAGKNTCRKNQPIARKSENHINPEPQRLPTGLNVNRILPPLHGKGL